MKHNLEILAKLADTIASRQGTSPEVSYTSKLLAAGTEKCAKKFGEEAVELALASVIGDHTHKANEAADVFYHLLVLLQSAGVTVSEVMTVLEAREGTSGHDEKATRRG
jgi:phosphoribosyl-ATP pyrophosphohydrolase